MYRPTFVPKLRINYEKTWARLTRFFKQPSLVQPAATPAHLQEALAPQKTIKRPQLKGNVFHTLKEIVAIFMADWNRAKAPINIAIQTTRASLSKRCRNRDPKTAYRHILALVEGGFLRAKVHIKGGLQLLLNPDLIVFDAAEAVQKLVREHNHPTVPVAPVLSPVEGLASLLAVAQNLVQNARRTT
jgi:hypothetical protein